MKSAALIDDLRPGELDGPAQGDGLHFLICGFDETELPGGKAALQQPGVWSLVLAKRAELGRPLNVEDIRKLLVERVADRHDSLQVRPGMASLSHGEGGLR